MEQPLAHPPIFTQEPVPPEPPKKSFPKWPFIALFSFFLGIASVLAYQKYQPARTLLAGPSPLVSPKPLAEAEAADSTTDWKTFSNQDFSFQYPSNWNITQKEFLNSVLIENLRKTVRITLSKGQYPYGLEEMGPETVQDISFEVSGKKYVAKETTLTNNQTTFVDVSLDQPSGYHVLFGTGYPAADDSNKSLNDYAVSKEIIYKILASINNGQAKDERDCITGEQKMAFSESFFVNKWFKNFTISGEWGSLNQDKTVFLEWGLDYAGPNDTRPNLGAGKWNSASSSIVLENTSISDGAWTDFRFFSYKNALFAIPREENTIIFGHSKQEIEDFFNNQIKPTLSNNTGCNK